MKPGDHTGPTHLGCAFEAGSRPQCRQLITSCQHTTNFTQAICHDARKCKLTSMMCPIRISVGLLYIVNYMKFNHLLEPPACMSSHFTFSGQSFKMKQKSDYRHMSLGLIYHRDHLILAWLAIVCSLSPSSPTPPHNHVISHHFYHHIIKTQTTRVTL